MVSVWTRGGIAVAYEDNLPCRFEEAFKEIFELRTEIETELKPEIEGHHNKPWYAGILCFFQKEQPSTERTLARKHAGLRRELAQNPKLRALRSLFDRTQPQELFDAWRDMSETEERLDSEDRHGFLEIGILVVYMTELCDMLGRLVWPDHTELVLIGMFVFAGLGVFVAYLLLRPKRKKVRNEALLLLGLMFLPIVAGIVYMEWAAKHSPAAPPPAHSTQAAAGANSSVSDHPANSDPHQETTDPVPVKHSKVPSHVVPATQSPQKK